MKPLISVVTPTYNRKEVVAEAIESVLRQEPKNYEVIVVDDGSDDGTLANLAGKYPEIIGVKLNTNGGPATARNEGIRRAKGKYIAFLDADDLWLPGKLLKQLAYFKANRKIHLVYTDEAISENGEIVERRFEANPPKQRNLYPAMVEYVPIHLSSVMVEKRVFDQVGLFDEQLRIGEDSEWFNRVSEQFDLGFINEALVIYRFAHQRAKLPKSAGKVDFYEEGRKYLDIYEQRKRQKGITEREEMMLMAARRKLQEMKRGER